MSLTNNELAHDEAVAQLEPFYSAYLDSDAFGFAKGDAPNGATWGELLEPIFQEISASGPCLPMLLPVTVIECGGREVSQYIRPVRRLHLHP